MNPYYDEDGITIYHGDCRDVVADLPVDLVLTDPPYGVGYDLGNDTDAPVNRWVVMDALERCKADSLIAFGTFDRYPLISWDWRWTLVWHKPMTRSAPAWGIARHYELAHWFTRGKAYLKPEGTVSDVIEANPPIFRTNPENLPHPAQKPEKLLQVILGGWRPAVVLDPFMGSGTTLRAAKNLGIKAIGIDVEEHYCEMAAQRLGQQVLAFGEAA